MGREIEGKNRARLKGEREGKQRRNRQARTHTPQWHPQLNLSRLKLQASSRESIDSIPQLVPICSDGVR